MNSMRDLSAASVTAALTFASLAALAQVAPPPPPAMTWQYGYDATGLLTTVIDPNAQVTRFHYDPLGRRIQSEQPANTGSASPTWIDYGWDLGDGLRSVTDPRSLTTTYTLNGLGRGTAQGRPDTFHVRQLIARTP